MTGALVDAVGHLLLHPLGQGMALTLAAWGVWRAVVR